MPEREPVRLQIAFEGGQIVPALVEADAADALARALADGAAVFDLETEDGLYTVALAKVVFVRRASRETRIGFGANA